MAPQRVLVLRCSGTWSQAHYDEQLERFTQVARNAQLPVKGEPVYARYNGPWVPWFMRRNEIWLPLEEQ